MSATRPRRVHVELLIGRKVVDANDQSVGRIAEIHATPDHAGHLLVREYRLRRHKLLDDISIAGVAGALVRLLGGHSAHSGVKIPWDKMDLSDPRHPRLLGPAEEFTRSS